MDLLSAVNAWDDVKHLIFLVQDVSGSMREPFSRDFVGGKELKINSIVSLLDKFYSSNFFSRAENLVDVYSCIFGTRPEKSYDLLTLINRFLTDGKKLSDEVKSESAKIDDPDGIIIRSMENCGAVNIAQYVEKVSEEDKKLIACFIKDDRDLCMKIVEMLPSAFSKNSLKRMFHALKIFASVDEEVKEHVKYAKELVMKKMRMLRKKRLNWDEYHDLVRHSLPELNRMIKEFSARKDFTTEFLSMIEDHIYGMTPMRDTFRRIENIIVPIHTQYNTKIILLVTDGASTDGSPIDFVPEFLNNTDTILATCFMSQHDLKSPRTLFDTMPSNLASCEKDLFNMSSEITTDSMAFDVLRNEGWTIPPNGKCRLFVQVNDRKTIDEFIEGVKKLFTSNNALLDLIGKVHMDEYVTNEKIKGFSVMRQVGGTCYAHAIATVIHLASSRVYGRRVEDFNTIKTKLVQQFGTHGANEIRVFDSVLGGYKLHYKRVDEVGARDAIYRKRPCVAVFALSNLDWWKFCKFYKDHPRGILRRRDFDTMVLTDRDIYENLQWEVENNSNFKGRKVEDLTEQEKNDIAKERVGHAVVLTRCGPRSLTFLNSWGKGWGNKGYFSIENGDVLGVTFYDVYWTEDDLSDEEKHAWETRNADLLNNVAPAGTVQELLKCNTECPRCKGVSQVREFSGTIYKVRCPKCGYEFQPTMEQLCNTLNHVSFNFDSFQSRNLNTFFPGTFRFF